MLTIKNLSVIAIASILFLGACTNPNQSEGGSDLSKTQQSAVIGAGIGDSLERQEVDLRREIDNEGVRITNTGDRLIVTMPQDLLFATDGFAVRPNLQDDLYALSDNLQKYPNSTIQVVGHTDSEGGADYNQQLSERRASSVRDFLASAGVPSSRVIAFGRGESQPVASNLSDSGKAQNRRVDIVILPNA